MQDLVLNCQFDIIGQLEPIAAKELDPVIAPRIVRCGDHDSSIETVRARQKCNGWRRHNAGALHRDPSTAYPRSERGCDPADSIRVYRGPQ